MKFRHLACTALLSLAASVSQAELVLKEGYARAMPPGQPNTAAFMLLANTSAQDVTLVSVSTSSAQKAELHNHTMEAGVMKMRAVSSVTVPAKGQFEFKPGAYHVMLMELNAPLTVKDRITLMFTDSNGEQHSVNLPVKSLVEKQSHEHHHHHH